MTIFVLPCLHVTAIFATIQHNVFSKYDIAWPLKEWKVQRFKLTF